MHVGVVDLVLAQHGLDRVQVQLRVLRRARQRDAAALLLAEADGRRPLVEPDPEPLELVLDQALVRERLEAVEHDQDQVAGPRRRDDLPPAPLAVLGALDDPRQVQKLDLGAAVPDDARDARQRGELVGRDLREGSRELVEQRRLADGREADEPDAGVADLVDVEAVAPRGAAAAAAAARGVEELAAELGELGLEHAQVARGGLVLLGAGHLYFFLGGWAGEEEEEEEEEEEGEEEEVGRAFV